MGFLSQPTIHLHPTTRCNLACRHCYSSSSPSSLQVAEIEAVCRCLPLLRAEGYEVASLSGGEALLYPHIEKLLSELQKLEFRTSLVSNGYTITPRYKNVLEQIDTVAISLDGDRTLHNSVRGSASAFDRALRALDYLAELGHNRAVVMCVTRRSLRDIPRIAEIALGCGASALQLRPLVAAGRARGEMVGEGLGTSDANRLFLITLALQQELQDRLRVQLDLVHSRSIAQHKDRYDPLLAEGDKSQLPLAALVNPLVITEGGRLRPLTYNLDPALDLGQVDSFGSAELRDYKRAKIGALRSRIGAALDRAIASDALLDWFGFVTEFQDGAQSVVEPS